MKKYLIPIAITLSLYSSITLAAQTTEKSKLDNRIQYQNYLANDVTVIKAKNGYATAVTFATDERIIDIAVGFNGWEVVDNNNIIYIKPVSLGDSEAAIEPIAKDWDTNLLITTNKRQYAFDLMLVDNEANDNAYFVKFQYPNEEARAKAEERARAIQEREHQIINDQLNNFTVPKNWDFGMFVGKNSRNIAPAFAYDDGIRTYLGFSPSSSMPAVFYYQGEQEMMANTSQKSHGDYSVLVIHNIAERYILRSGNQVLGIINHGFGKVNTFNDSYTSDKRIDRVIK